MIYQKDVGFFLDCFSTSLPEIESIWDEQGGFVSPDRLVTEIIKRKGYAPEVSAALSEIAVCCFPIDYRSGALERQNFFYGLADYYAETGREPATLVEFDVGNCNGTGDVIGDDMLLKVIRYMRHEFEVKLAEAGATFVQPFDNAKNDDLKFIVTGLSGEKLTGALIETQDSILRKLIFAHDIPHSKYKDGGRNGIGVGSGYVHLGRNRTPQVLQERLNLFVEKRKLEDAEKRRAIRLESNRIAFTPNEIIGCLAFVFNSEACTRPSVKKDFPFPKDGVRSIADPFMARKAVCEKLAGDLRMSDAEKVTFDNILKFYHSSEALTGAHRDSFLHDDMHWVLNHAQGGPVTILNVKVENCAGLNKVLSHIHSAEMTKHFVEILSDFTERNFGSDAAHMVYYVGRNSFNVILPGTDRDLAEDIFKNYFQGEVDRHINDQPMGPYFARFGLVVPDHLKDEKVATVPNLRGLPPGVLAININAVDAGLFPTEAELIGFQNRCLSLQRSMVSSRAVLNLPNDLTFHDVERGRTPLQLLAALRAMANELIETEQKEEDTRMPTVLPLPSPKIQG